MCIFFSFLYCYDQLEGVTGNNLLNQSKETYLSWEMYPCMFDVQDLNQKTSVLMMSLYWDSHGVHDCLLLSFEIFCSTNDQSETLNNQMPAELHTSSA